MASFLASFLLVLLRRNHGHIPLATLLSASARLVVSDYPLVPLMPQSVKVSNPYFSIGHHPDSHRLWEAVGPLALVPT
jgi:hypothetical protein